VTADYLCVPRVSFRNSSDPTTLIFSLQDRHIACKPPQVRQWNTNQTKWNAVLLRVVMRVRPDYFALPQTEREYYRLRLNTEAESNPG